MALVCQQCLNFFAAFQTKLLAINRLLPAPGHPFGKMAAAGLAAQAAIVFGQNFINCRFQVKRFSCHSGHLAIILRGDDFKLAVI